jgi:hypothetical protein
MFGSACLYVCLLFLHAIFLCNGYIFSFPKCEKIFLGKILLSLIIGISEGGFRSVDEESGQK